MGSVLTERLEVLTRLAVIVSSETSSCVIVALAFQFLLVPVAQAVLSQCLLSFSPKASSGMKIFTFSKNHFQFVSDSTCEKFIFLLSRRRVADFRSSSSSESRWWIMSSSNSSSTSSNM